MSQSAVFKSEGQTQEGCQRQKSSGAFQMLYRGCEFILLKSKTIFLNTKQPQCQQVTFVSRVWERTLGEAYTHKQCHSVCLVHESLSATRHTVYATLTFFLRFFFFTSFAAVHSLCGLPTIFLLPEQFPNCSALLQGSPLSAVGSCEIRTFPLQWNTSLSVLLGRGLKHYYFRWSAGISASFTEFMFTPALCLYLRTPSTGSSCRMRFSFSFGERCKR